ncbi:hypothetical protein KPH14_000957 [Odynerus spinipes]|uniref:FP protein C-terminal domain-containing protein n=1 Tax=Odynerus spinipes TaxID=1348599 RepID=A0AAD9R8X2_9HYME|nr:hypothetical protein KPH14_000957 [Odynerus spinipes]
MRRLCARPRDPSSASDSPSPTGTRLRVSVTGRDCAFRDYAQEVPPSDGSHIRLRTCHYRHPIGGQVYSDWLPSSVHPGRPTSSLLRVQFHRWNVWLVHLLKPLRRPRRPLNALPAKRKSPLTPHGGVKRAVLGATVARAPPAGSPSPPPPESSEATLLSVLAAVQSFSDTLNVFRVDQDRCDKDADHRLSTRLNDLRKNIADHMDRLSADLCSVSSRVKGVETRVDGLGAEMKDLSTKQEKLSGIFTSRLARADERQKSYSEVLRGNEAATSTLATKVVALTAKISRLEGDRRASELVVSGLPETPNEDLPGVFVKISTLLGAPLTTSHIARAARMRGSPDVNRPQLDHVILTSRASRDALISAKRRKRQFLASEVDESLGPRPIHINEYLPRNTWALLRLVRVVARERSYQHVWVRSGRIFVRKESGTTTISITSPEDLNKLS